uniref:Uncharacterized protein n=1 Tax=Anguilla anguilla TaxID=7936 RepID=A0A0E9RIQ2_ANGAN
MVFFHPPLSFISPTVCIEEHLVGCHMLAFSLRASQLLLLQTNGAVSLALCKHAE